jgi:uncharacterized protein YcnI
MTMLTPSTPSRPPMPLSRGTSAIVLGVVLCLLAPALALGHAVVFPKSSAPGAFERYVLRVPNEKAVPTTRVEIRFPGDLRVTAFEDVPGWQVEIRTDSAKRIVGAVWTGALPPQRFVEFPFMAANPKTSSRLVWPTYQTYAGGERVEWTGEQGTKTPASITMVEAASPPADHETVGPWLPWIAVVLSLVSLGLVLRRPEVTPRA